VGGDSLNRAEGEKATKKKRGETAISEKKRVYHILVEKRKSISGWIRLEGRKKKTICSVEAFRAYVVGERGRKR